MSTSITDLTDECLFRIFHQLDLSELTSISKTCRRLKKRVECFKSRHHKDYYEKVDKFNRSSLGLPDDCLYRIFLLLDYYELGSISRTCRYLNKKVDDFKRLYPGDYNKKLEKFYRWFDDNQPFNFEQDEQDDREPGPNPLIDYENDAYDDEYFREIYESDDDDHHRDGYLDDDVRSFGSNLEISDEDDV